VDINHQMVVIQVQVGRNFIDDVLIDGGFGINIIIENLKVQLGLSKPNPTPYNLHMANQTIAKPLGFIRDLKIFLDGIPYMVTFTIINNNVLDYNYSMLLRCPWLRYAKVSHDWGIHIITIQGTDIVKTMHVTNKLGVQTKRPKVLFCYDFHYGITNDKKDVMFTIKLDLFSIGNITIPTQIDFVPSQVCIPNTIMAKLVLKQLVKLVGVLAMELVIPLDIVKQHLPKTFFHPED
jgi:hypothetical protein